MLSIINIPSSGIVHSTKETEEQILSGNKDYLVNRWRDKVDKETIIKSKEILQSFDIEIYKDSLI